MRKKIIDGLKERGFSVSVMTVAFEEALKDVETVNDVTIYCVNITKFIDNL